VSKSYTQTKQKVQSTISFILNSTSRTGPEFKSQDRGNSGVYQQGRYELQVLDSYQNETYRQG